MGNLIHSQELRAHPRYFKDSVGTDKHVQNLGLTLVLYETMVWRMPEILALGQ